MLQQNCKFIITPFKPIRDTQPAAKRRSRQQQVETQGTRVAVAAGSSPAPEGFSRRTALLLGAAGTGSFPAAVVPQPAGAAASAVANVAPVGINVRDETELGRSGLRVSQIGIGAWSWGDRTGFWGYGGDYNEQDNMTAYEELVQQGIGLIDTAEVYGFGLSEELIRSFMQRTGTQPVIATKFGPLPWRFTAGSVEAACRGSLARLGIPKLGLYQIHWPGFLTNGWANENFVRGLARCHSLGLTEAVGVSNFNERRLRSANSVLEGEGVPLASNQVQYSLLYRAPETNGVLDAARELGVKLIAYSPLAQGLLTGKYTEDNLPGGPRSTFITKERVREVQPLLGLMREIGAAHGGKTPSQVAINWTVAKGAYPIPGAKNARQVRESAGAMGWALTPEEVEALDQESSKVSTGVANPVENF